MDNEEKGRLSTDEIMIMCKKLAYKYHQVSMRDDLISEGILAVYERLDKDPEVHPSKLYNVARLAMFEYVNIKTKVLNIPVNQTTRAIAAGREHIPQYNTYSQEGVEDIRNALQPSVEFNDEYIAPAQSGSKGYEDKEFIENGLNLLTERERDVIKSRYYDNKTQEELATKYRVTQKTISIWESSALYKMKNV